MRSAAFFHRVYGFLAHVPEGHVITYGQIATALGNPRQARAVGWAMQACPEGLPWHRVVNARGGLSTSPLYGNLQQRLLEDEGVQVGPDGRVDLSRYGWGRPYET